MSIKINKTTLDIEDFLELEDGEENILILPYKGVDTSWGYKTLSWWETTDCVAKATKIITSEAGEPSFNFDLATYYTEMLLKMITSAPIPITPTTIKRLKGELGDRLVEIVPAPLASGPGEAIKKEPENSLEEVNLL